VARRKSPPCRCLEYHEEKWIRTDKQSDGEVLDPTQLVAFQEGQPLTVVFVTNGTGFGIKSKVDNSIVHQKFVTSSMTLLDGKGTIDHSATESTKKVLDSLPQNVIIELEICSR